MSHEEQPYQSSTPSSHEGHHYVASDLSRTPPYPPRTEGVLARPEGVTNANKEVNLTPFQSWTLRASDSQFNAAAGSLGGIASGVVTCPLDVIKTKLQAQGGFIPIRKQGGHVGHTKLYNGLVGTARTIWRDEGLRGMYRGLGPIVMGYLPTWAVWFTVYNKSKDYLNQRYGEFVPRHRFHDMACLLQLPARSSANIPSSSLPLLCHFQVPTGGELG